jgi:type I restriction enzyme, S subunit
MRKSFLLWGATGSRGVVEQQRLVELIDEMASQVADAHRLHQEAVKEITVLEQRYTDLVLQKRRGMLQPLGELLAEPLMNGLSVPASQLGSGICFAKVGTVNTGKFNPLETKRVNIDLPENSSYWLRPGDIVVSRGNAPELVGRAAVYEGDPPECAIPDLLIRMRIDPTKLDGYYLVKYFQTSEARSYIAAQISGTSSTMPKIFQSKLAAMPIPCPHLTDQRRTAAEIDAMQREITEIRRLKKATTQDIDALLPSILDCAFRGEL